MHRVLLTSLVVLVCIAAALTILQMWVPFLAWGIFMKIMITLGILGLLAALLMIFRADLSEHKKLKDENYLD